MHFDDLMIVLGEFGRYQRVRFFLLCLFSIASAWHALNMVFIGAAPEFQCDLRSINFSGTPLEDLTPSERTALLIPPESACYQYNFEETASMLTTASDAWSNRLYTNDTLANSDGAVTFANVSRGLVTCTNGYEYSRDVYSETITSEFDLVCEKSFWKSTSKSVFFSGRLCGAVVFGQLSDRFGRRPMFFIGCLMLLIAGTVASLAPSMAVFLPMYFCQGAAHTGAFLVAYTLATEMVGPRYRVMAGFVSQSFYSIGFMTLAGIAFFIREWRYLEIAITVPIVLFGLYWWFLPESIRWLISRGREVEADRIIRTAAATNRVTLDADIVTSLKQDPSMKADRHYYFVDCVNTWQMARLSLNVWFNWLVNALVYYGLSLNTENLAGNPYLNFCVAGAVEIPAYAICILLLNKMGRRRPLVVSMLVGGIACILSGCIPTGGSPAMETVTVVLAMVGKFGITASYGIIYLMAAEIFPTVIRNIGMGVASMSARIGGILAPLILDLQSVSKPLPLVIFGALSIFAGVMALLLPETAGRPLAQLPEDMDHGSSCSDAFCFFKKPKRKDIDTAEMTNCSNPLMRSK
ncbi:organic cation transporter protein [Elysia marginata]|uniref:Organic cation transporter protein n=1 Tax=Elysia marginata TaxID=1093978 RepID=A0AAV4HM46_9GAST|nr:organic cation transporter protein [Elysia marginata]